MSDQPGSSGPGLAISDVRIGLCDGPGIRAFVTVVLNSAMVVRGLRVIQGSHGLFVAMPCRKQPDGSFGDQCYPIQAATRAYMEEVILRAYFDALGSAEQPVGAKLPRGPQSLSGKAMLQPPLP